MFGIKYILSIIHIQFFIEQLNLWKMFPKNILHKTKLTMVTKKELKELAILGIRTLFFVVFMSYGIGKLTGGQFGNLTQEELNTPIKDLSLFKVGWYLFDHQPFKAFIGISQIIAALLLLFNRTYIIGLLIFLPIITNILIIDLTIMPYGFKVAFFFRLTFYLLYIALILFHFKKSLNPGFRVLIENRDFKPQITNKWKYLYLILIIPILEMISGIFQYAFLAIKHYDTIWDKFRELF